MTPTMSYQFVCDHCGKKFELETPQAAECPSCFWTSSVKRDEVLGSEQKSFFSSAKAAMPKPKPLIAHGFFFDLLKRLLFVLLALVVIAGVGFFGYKGYKIFMASHPHSISIFGNKDVTKPAKKGAGQEADAFSVQEKAILGREVGATLDRTPDAGEQSILARVVSFQTGRTEKLPSTVWTLNQYQKMIQSQETLYKMPFARSYKKKLEDLFKAKYLAASDAFIKGDLLAARNLWMESLAFPLYSTDLRKHRAVALTMLRPFINDTLSKISTMNQSLADQSKRNQEELLSRNYQKLLGLMAQKKWQEALATIDPMIASVNELRKNAKPQPLPQYPASFASIDLDLQRALMDLMMPNPSSTADLQPLQQDLVEKKEILGTFTEGYVKNVNAIYQSALRLIRDQKWQEAVQALESIPGPRILQEDAAQKIAILKRRIPAQ